MGDTASKRVIAGLMKIDPEIRSSGFRKSLAELSSSRYFLEAAGAFLPDGYLLDHDEARVLIYEVVDTHPIRPDKAACIAELSDELDDIGWELLVVTLDYTGHPTSELPGWAYMPAYTSMVAPPNCLDMTPAARAVARAREGERPATPEELLEAVRKLPF
jgi:hypothetical protein